MSLYKQPGSDNYFCKFKIAGRVYRKSTSTADVREAERFERAYRVALEKELGRVGISGGGTGSPGDGSAQVGLEYFLERDLLECKAKGGRDGKAMSKGYERQLKYAYGQITRLFGKGAKPKDITYDRTLAYINTRREEQSKYGKSFSGQTIALEVQILKRVVLEAATRGLCLAPIRWPRVKRGNPDEKLQGRDHGIELARAYINQLPEHIQHVALFAMLTGWRRGTLEQLEPHFFQPPAADGLPAFAHLPAGIMKGRKQQTLPIPAAAYEIVLYRVRNNLTVFGRVFSFKNYRRACRQALRAIGYSDTVTLRDLRTTFANAALRSGVGIESLQHLLSHADIRTTQKYLRIQSDDLSRAVLTAQTFTMPALLPAKSS
jgi:integrase